MYYEKRLTIPAGTEQASPETDDIPLDPGVLQRVWIDFPAGCAGLAHLQIHLWSRQLYPRNPDSDIAADDRSIDFSEDYEIKDPPFALGLVGWNEDDTYDHTITVRVQVIPFEKDLRTLLLRTALGPTGPKTFTGV